MSSAFAYRARDPLGAIHEGRVEAPSADDARRQLGLEGFHVLELDEESSQGLQLFGRRITRTEIIYATSQLAIMVDTGITLAAGLDGMIEQEQNAALRLVLIDLKSSVESGDDFSTALNRHPKLFDRTFISLVRAAEATGSLGSMLDRIATYLRKELEMRNKVRAAMAYPMVMMCVAIAVTIFLLTFVLPRFTPMFASRGMELPTPTRVMMAVSGSLTAYWYFWIAGIAASVVGVVYGRRTPQGMMAIDWIKIHTPIVGPMFRKVILSRSIRTLGTMVGSGVSVLDALQLSADVAGNCFYERVWRNVLDKVTSGSQIHEGLARNSLIPAVLVQMIRSGEETGKLDLVLQKVSGYYDNEVETSIKATTSLIEPLMIAVMGAVVGTIGLALLLPIFTLSRPAG
jgi:type IV pilus assembly protein PilC